MKKKSILSIIALMLIVSLLAGCTTAPQAEAPKPAAPAAPAKPTEVKIGINYELSGGVASYGEQSVKGIMMAFDEINAAGGINGMKIVPVQVDNKSESAEATALATKLMTQDKVVAVLGPATSGNFKATIPVAMENKIPVISSSATADKGVTTDDKGKVNDFVFRTCFVDSFQGVTMASFAINNLKAKNAVIIKDNSSDYSKGLAENFKKTIEAAGGKIVAEEGFVAKDKDFNAVLTKIKSQQFDVIFVPGYYEEAGLIIKQARDLGINVPVLGADGFGAPELVDLAGAKALNNIYYSDHYSSLDKDPLVLKFIADFKAKNGKEPTAFNALGYDMGKFIADAIKRADSTDPVKIKDALAATKGFVGVTGTFDMSADHNPIKAAVVVGLKDGVQDSSVKVSPK